MSSHVAQTTLPIAPDVTPGAVVRLDSVGVRYRVALDKGRSLKEFIVRRPRWRIAEFEALRDVDLEVRRGESVGVIGRNGAGKTTLLRLIARVLHPTSGRVRIRGSVAPMIDLFGASHPDLTGRENVYLTGALLGLSRARMHQRIDAIAEFADIGEFFNAPLRTYSAGMVVRLAFAAASSIDADILLIDEALAVGDAAFQRKSAARIDEIRRSGVTSIIASHDVGHLAEICDRIVWLDEGRVIDAGPGHEIARRYLDASG